MSSVQSLSPVQLFSTPWTAACQATLSITNSQSMLKLISIQSVMPYSNLILCHPFLLPPSTFPSIRVFSNEPIINIRWPKYWRFSFSLSPSFQLLFGTDFLYDGLAWFPCSPRDSQESSIRVHFKSINSLVLNFLYSLTLTSIQDYWKNHNFENNYRNKFQELKLVIFENFRF